MLQRAASNAYSWWWASHIRTKQSKWLEQSLQEMEEKVEYILKLFQEDGDSFIKKAEMYYKRRPEFIEFVEESARAYRALAGRYDKLSTDLQNANTTIATCLPEQVQYSMDDDDDYDVKGQKGPKGRAPPQPAAPGPPPPNVPKVPEAPNKALRGLINNASKKLSKKPAKQTYTQIKPKPPPKSGLTETEASEEVDMLQKDILALQTVKEFVKSSYENGLEKFRKIENEITEKQDRASKLQDEFGITSVIEDNDARNLMANTALKSCQETLSQLQTQQEKCNKEAEAERKRLDEARVKLKALKHQFLPDEPLDDETPDDPEALAGEEVGPEEQKLEEIREKIKELDESSDSITMTELAEKINELVNQVIYLESSVSSQNVLNNRLKTEADDLNSHIQHFEDDKATIKDEKQNVGDRVEVLEAKLKAVQTLNRNVAKHNTQLRAHFTVVYSGLHKISEKLHTVKPEEEGEQSQEASDSEDNKEITENTRVDGTIKIRSTLPDENQKSGGEEINSKSASIDMINEDMDSDDEETYLPQLLLSGVEDKDKILKKEYATILRNYKEIKKRILNQEKTSDALFQTTLKVRELRNAVAKRDLEIQSLRNKLQDNAPEAGLLTEGEDANTHPEEGVEEEINSLINESKPISPFEGKLRGQIDGMLDENLEFLLRFSTTFQQIQKFKSGITDLQEEISTFKPRQAAKKQEGKPEVDIDLKSDVRAVFRHLNEIKSELKVWLEQIESLKEELQSRFSSLCTIQKTITSALKEGAEKDEIAFTSHQAATYQGEVLNMKQENNKVGEELQGGIDSVTSLQTECKDAIEKLDVEYGLTENAARNVNKPGIPLRSFIFGVKEKKKKPSLLSYMHHPKK
ncbi:NAB domain-containing protein [Heracleum sosnowskyi]|uniref:NAB domain-containing protein n=1 Tax=Heracleum sosnowskyi TaxID=360622 RepID=A0AAD8H5Z0_9APIA|nr:NAB domain-containing protein [Heracleum sosnowskyi]